MKVSGNKECMEMTEVDWEFRINNQTLLEATAQWKAKPSALKTIDNFWGPRIQSRGKRKRIIAEDDEDGGTAVDSSKNNRQTTEQADRESPATVNYCRGRRQQNFKRLRISRPPQHIVTEQSTQDFLMEENNVTDEETFVNQKVAENFEEQSDFVKTANQYKNECAADAFIVRMEERLGFDRAAQNSGPEVVEHSRDSLNIVEEIPAEANRRQERRRWRNNVEHHRRRTAKKKKRSINLSSDSSILEPLQLIMGSDKVSTQDDTQCNGLGPSDFFRTDNAGCSIACAYINSDISRSSLITSQPS